MSKQKKPIRAARCKYMPTKENTVIIFSSKHGDFYKAGFTIGNQDFTVGERETKEEAKWMCNMLEIAFNSLIEPKCIGLLNGDNIERYENSVKYTTVKNIENK